MPPARSGGRERTERASSPDRPREDFNQGPPGGGSEAEEQDTGGEGGN